MALQTTSGSTGKSGDPASLDTGVSSARQWYLVVALMLVGLVGALDRQCLSVLAPLIKADLQLTDTQLSLLLSVSFAVFNTLTAIPAGWLIDRYSRKVILGVGALLWSTVTALSGFASTFTQLFWGRAGVGFAEGGLGPGAFAMIRDTVAPSRRGRAFSIYGLSNSIGNGLSFSLVGLAIAVVGTNPSPLPVVGELHTWQIVLIGLGLISLPFALLVLPITEAPRTPSREAFIGGYVKAAKYMGGKASLFVPITLYMACISSLSAGFIAWAPSVGSRSYDLPIHQVGVTFGSIAAICLPTGMIVSGFVIDAMRSRGNRLAPAWVALAILLLNIIPTSTMTLMPTATAFWIMSALSLVTISGLFAITNNLLAMVTPRDIAGRVVGLYTLCYTILATIGPLLVGVLSDHVYVGAGNRSLAYALATSAATFATLSILTIMWTINSLKKAGDELQ